MEPQMLSALEEGLPMKERPSKLRLVPALVGAVLGALVLMRGSSQDAAGGATHGSPKVEPRGMQSASSPYLTLAVGACANAVTVTPSLASSQYYAIVADIKALLAAQDQTCSGSTCPVARLAGCIVRMAGHDLMDFDPSAAAGQTGGPDGCVDFGDSDNNGLESCLAYGVNLGAVYSNYCHSVSLADFIVIAAEAVMILRSQCQPTYYNDITAPPGCSSTNCSASPASSAYTVPFCSQGTLSMQYMAQQFRYGRVTSTTCSWANGRLPDPAQGCAASKSVFMTRMSLAWEEITALMGVHTLGGASSSNSGYSGFWSDVVNQSYFNNDYYVSLLGKGWVPELAVGGNPKRNQWARSDKTGTADFMLDTDMCLVYNFDNTSTGLYGEIAAATSNCCAWLTDTALTGCTSTSYVKGAELQCWDQTMSPSSSICGSGGKRGCCQQSAGLQNCASIRQPMQSPSWNLLSGNTGFGNSDFTSFNQVKLYAANSTRWYEDFLSVWAKATTIGQGQLKCIDDLCTTTTTTSTTTVTSTSSTKTTTTVTSTSSSKTTTTATSTSSTKTTTTATTTSATTTSSSKTTTTTTTSSVKTTTSSTRTSSSTSSSSTKITVTVTTTSSARTTTTTKAGNSR